jgi:hypothetical protein
MPDRYPSEIRILRPTFHFENQIRLRYLREKKGQLSTTRPLRDSMITEGLAIAGTLGKLYQYKLSTINSLYWMMQLVSVGYRKKFNKV